MFFSEHSIFRVGEVSNCRDADHWRELFVEMNNFAELMECGLDTQWCDAIAEIL